MPRVIYPLNHDYQGRDLTGRGSDITFIGVSIGDTDRPGGALQLVNDESKYAEIKQADDTLRFNVS